MKNSIKILHTEWSGGWGGQEIRILSEMQGMQDRGFWVGLAAAAHTPIYKRAQELGFPVFALGFRGNLDLKTFFGLIKIIKQNKINIINTHSSKDTWVGGLAAKFSKIKFIRTRHLSYAIKKTSFINRLADHIVTTSENTRIGMIKNQNIDPEKITAVSTRPSELEFNPENFNKAVLRKKFNIPEDAIVIGIVGFLRRMKRMDLFLELAVILKDFVKSNKIKKNIKFIIVGDGPCRAELEKIILEKNLSDDVVITGHVNNPAEYMAMFDIGVLTSDQGESSPQALTQYLMMSLPVVVTDICDLSELSQRPERERQSYKLSPINNLEHMVSQLILLINNLNYFSQEAQKLRPWIIEHYGFSKMIDQMEEIVQKVVG